MEQVLQILTVVMPVLAPFVVGLVKKGVGYMPGWSKPALAIGLGALIDVASAYLNTGWPAPWGAVAAASGIVVREAFVPIRDWIKQG